MQHRCLVVDCAVHAALSMQRRPVPVDTSSIFLYAFSSFLDPLSTCLDASSIYLDVFHVDLSS